MEREKEGEGITLGRQIMSSEATLRAYISGWIEGIGIE